MKATKPLATAPLIALLALAGCSQPKTPQEVTQAFWEAVVEGNAADAAQLSTLVDEQGFDGYSLNWTGAQISWGRVTVDGQEASIDTVFSALPDMEGEDLETTTYLLQINDHWQVDYHETGDAVRNDVRLGSLMGSVRAFSDKLSSRLADESERANKEFDRLLEDLSTYSEETRDDISALIEEYGDRLSGHMDELSNSLDEALDENPSASEQDRQTIKDARKNLERQQDALDESEPDTVADISKELARIQDQLAELSDQSFRQLKEELQRWSEQLNRELEELNDDVRTREQQSI